MFNRFTIVTWIFAFAPICALQIPLWYPFISSCDLYITIILAFVLSFAFIFILSTKTLLDFSKLYSIIIGSFNFLSTFIFKSTFDCSFDWFKKYSPNPNFNFTSSLWFNTQFSLSVIFIFLNSLITGSSKSFISILFIP